MVGEVRLASHVQAGNGAHEVVVHPEAAHGVMHGRVDAHGLFVRILIRDALVHVEQVAIPLGDGGLAQSLDAVGKVEVHSEAARTHAAPVVARFLGGARGDVPRREVAEARVLALQEVIALGVRNLRGRPMVAALERHPDAPVVAQRLRHERELRLMVPAHRDAGGVDLRVARVGECRALLVRPPRGRDVGVHGVRAQVEHVAVAAGGEHHRVGRMRRDLAGEQIARHDAARVPVHHDQLEHLLEGVHLHLLERRLPFQRLIGAKQQLLPGLAAGVEGARHLRPAERPVGQQAAILTRKGHPLRHALVDDVHRHLRQAIHVRLAGAEVTPLDGVVEEPLDGVAVVLVVLGGVDAALRRDGVRTPGRVVEDEAGDVVAQLRHGGGGRGASETGPHHDHMVLPLVGGVDQLHLEAVLVPLLLEGTAWCLGVQFEHVSASPPRPWWIPRRVPAAPALRGTAPPSTPREWR